MKKKDKIKPIKPHFSFYYDQETDLSLRDWMQTRGVVSKSQAVLLILREYFGMFDSLESLIGQIVDKKIGEFKNEQC